jgi:hypothetical protein
MGGQTAERLFRLLPLHMPLETKYRLIENLWNHVGARTRKTLRVGLDANTEQVMEAVRKHLEEVVVPHRIPSALEGRFNWLAAGDTQLKQDLLNHVRQHMEKNLVVEGARLQLPIMQDHLRGDAGRNTLRLAQILKLGNHELEVLIDKNALGVAIVEPQVFLQSAISRVASAAKGQRANFKWLWWAAAAAVALYFFVPSFQPNIHTTVARPQTSGASDQTGAHATRLPVPPISKPAVAGQLKSASVPDVLSDHGGERAACDAQWSELHRKGSQNGASGYPEFLRTCMRRNPRAGDPL